jgi:tetratricopeptide (TPR) repeat protein
VGESKEATKDRVQNGILEDFPPELREQAAAAFEAERASVDKGIDAWKKVVASSPTEWAPRRELARVYKKAERWKACVEVLKEGVEKATWSSPEKKVPVLFEMVELYRDRLKLDVMVVNAFNQILTIQPDNLEAVDALASQYQGMGRWPELISLLRKKAAVVESPEQKILLHLKVANLYLEKFSNQAEAIKSFETILELDPTNPDALSYLKQMYEKRRDWEKLVAIHRQEIDRLSDPEDRRKRWVDVAKLATEKLKKPSVCIDLWQKVLAERQDDPDALGELEKLYEREKMWGELAAVLERQGAQGTDGARRAALLGKLAILYTEKLQDLPHAIGAWRSLLVVEPENRRAQDALRKLYLQNKDWDALEEFYSAQNKFDEFVRVLERQAETEDDSVKVGLWNKIAQLYRDRLGKSDRAQKAYERALALDARNQVAAEALVPLYEKAKDPRRLANVLQVQLLHTTDREDRQQRMLRITQLFDAEVGDKVAAASVALDAFAENPLGEWPQAYAERLAEDTGGWAALASAYETALPAIGRQDPRATLPLLATLARAYERALINPEAAIARNQAILELSPQDEEAVLALERLYIGTERYPDLLAIYDKKLALAHSDAERREVRFRLAGLYEEQIRDADKAVGLYRDILKEAPQELSALRALDRLYRATEQWKELADTIEKELELIGEDDKATAADLRFRLGEVYESRLDDKDSAVAAYRDALTLDPRHDQAQKALEVYLKDKKRQMKAVAALEPIYEALQDLPRLIEAQRIRLHKEKSSPGKVALLLRIGGYEQALGRAEEAFSAFADAFREDPAAAEARTALEDLANALGKWDQLVALYTDAQSNRKLEPALERELLLVVAVAYDEKLEQSDKAVEYFRLAQEIVPEDASALVALERLYTRTERWPDLVDTLKKKAELARTAEDREQIHIRIATIFEEMIGNADEAITAWKEVLGDNPGSLIALRSLDRLFAEKGLDLELADNLQRQLELTGDPDEIVNLLSRLGQLQERKLGDLDLAVETYRRLLELSPQHDETVAALERILPDPGHELALAELLEPVYQNRSDFANLVRVHEIQVRHALDPRKKIALLQEIAASYEDGLDDPHQAYQALARALAENPLEEETQRRVERLARVLGHLEDLVARYQSLVEAVSSDELKNVIYHKIAALAEQELARDDLAAAAYLNALKVAPRDLGAAEALERIYVRTADYARLVQLYLRKMDMVDELEVRKELGFRAAQLYEEVLEDSERAIEVYRQVFSLDPTDTQVLDQLERLYLRMSRWNDYKDVYAKKVELATDRDEKKRMLAVIGQVYDRELQNPERAIESYTAILDIDPDDFDAVLALDRLYVQTERWYDLLGVLERQTELTPSAHEVVSLRFRIGNLWREKLKDPTQAAEAYRQVLAMDPTHEPTLRSLDAMMAEEAGEQALLAAQVLQPIYETAGEWDRVVAVYEVMVAATEDPVRKTELLAKIADIHERRLAAFDNAFDAYTRALRVDPTNPDVIAHLDRLSEVTGRWSDLAVAYEAEVERVMDSRLQVEMLLRIGRIYEEETHEVDKAIVAYRRVSEAEPDRKDGLVALDRLYTHTQNWAELADVLRREIRLADTEDQIIELTFRLAQILELAVGDMPRAVEAYQDILNANPAHAETREALERLLRTGQMQHEIAQVLEPLYRLGEEWDKLVEIYQLELERLKDPEERQGLLRRVADIAENKLFDQVAAFEWWSRAAQESPASEQALDELLRLARITHQWDGYVSTMLEAGQNAREPGVRRDVLIRLAAVFESDLGELQRAEEVLGQILEEQPQDVAALSFLDRIHDKQGNFEQLAEVLRRRIAITDDSKELVTLQLRLGKVLAEVLDETEGAITAYNAVLEQESRSSEALDALERLYFRGERWEDLYGVYEKMIDIAPGDEALSDCYARMAKITSDVFGKRDKAIELWRRVLDLRGVDGMALSALADLHEQAGEWRELTEVLDNQIRGTNDAMAKIPLYKRLGRIWGEKLSRERNALECWQRVLEIDPGDVEALRAIAENYRSAGAWEELSDTLQRLINLGSEIVGEDELKELYSQLGELEGATLMRTQMAIDAWRHVLDIDPTDFRALAALETLFTQEGRWEECVEVLERRAAALASPEDQVDVLMQVADIWSDKIGDGGAAAEVYERVLAVDPSNMTASIELEQLYRQRSNWMKLVELLLARTDFVSDTPERVKLFMSIAEIYEQQLGDRDRAFVILEAAFQEDYSHDRVAAELERLATVAGKWNELIGQYTQVVQGIEDVKQAADLWVKIARWYDSALGHVEYAIHSASEALRLDAAHMGALSALQDFYRKQSRWRELVGVLARHAEVEQEPTPKVEILLALADTYETQLGDTAQATAAYQQVLEHDERSMPAIDALERLYRRMGAWDRLVDVLAKKSHTVDDGELAVKLRLQVGDLWEERLGDNARAVDAYREVLTVDPQNLPALKALERLYEKTGNMEAYLDVIEHQLEVTGEGEERVSLYQRMAQVWEEQFAKNDRAIDCLQKILIIDDRNQRAYRDLERLYRTERNWDALVENYRRHILVATDPGERIELYSKMGQVYEDELHDPDRAIEAFGDVLSFEPDHVDALRGLARLYEQTDQWERAVEVMQRLVGSVDTKEQVDINYRLGKIFDEQMRSPETAEERLIEALAIDPTHVPSMLALLTLYRRRGDSLKAAQLMVRAEANTQNVLEKTRLLFEAGKIYQQDIGDEDKATELFARTLALDPEHVEAAEPLAELYFRRQQFAPLVPLLEMLARKADRKANRELNVLYYRLAKATDQLGDAEKALRYYKQAYELDSTHLPTLLDRANLLYRREQWDDAFKLYQTILVHHRESQKDSDIVEIFHRIGQIKLKVGERAKAINMFEKALEIFPGHRPTLEALVDIYSAANDWEAVIRQKRALLAHRADPDEKLAVHEQIIQIYKEKIKNPQKAIAAYLEALEIKPNAHHLLHDVLDLFTETKQWKKAVEILMRLAGLEKGKLRAKYLEAAGNITNYELHASDEAVELYNQALDEDPDNLKTFERIDKIMTAKKDWKNQERAYRRMIKRLGNEVPADKRPTQVALWHALGEIYRSRQKDFRAATQAFEVCVQLEPDALPRHQILAELYQMQGPEGYEKALREYRFIIKKAPDPLQVGAQFKTLRRLYMDLNQYDRAWCVTAVLGFLRMADPEEQRFYEQYRPKGLARAKARLNEELWQKSIYHSDEDRYISQVLGAVSPSVAAVRAREHKDFGLKRKDKRDPTNDQLLFSKVFNYVSQVLNIPQPELFLQPEKPFELEMINTRDKMMLTPAFVVGANLLQGRPEKELAYVVGKRLAMMRPDHLVRWPHVVPTVSELTTVFLAALKLAVPSVPVVKQQYEKGVAEYLGVLRGLVPPQLLEQLVVVVQRFLSTKSEADLNRWSRAVDYTATRAGYLMCNDLEVAARLVQSEPVTVGSVDPKDKIRDLIQWTVSDEYFALREQLGLTIA